MGKGEGGRGSKERKKKKKKKLPVEGLSSETDEKISYSPSTA